MFIILAHGGLGNWDEFIFLGIAVIFTGFMGMSWWRSRDFEAELNEKYDEQQVD